MFGHVICLKFKNIRYTHAKIKNIIQYKNVKVQKKHVLLKRKNHIMQMSKTKYKKQSKNKNKKY